MKRFYFRWGGMLLIGLLITIFSAQRYYREVHSLTPEQLLRGQPPKTLRILGRVEAGTLMTEASRQRATFQLAGKEAQIAVLYQGEALETLRELKTLVVVGRWDALHHQFEAHEIDLIPNYGFITAAYLTMIPMAVFLFMMERRVLLLYNEIRQSKLYEPEVADLDDG